jgi:hypothetical protein
MLDHWHYHEPIMSTRRGYLLKAVTFIFRLPGGDRWCHQVKRGLKMWNVHYGELCSIVGTENGDAVFFLIFVLK